MATIIRYAPQLAALVASSLSMTTLAHTAEPVRAPHAMVVCASREAAQIGADIMRQGGNAFDAAAAVGFALAVTWPEAGNLGGGGFMVAVTSARETITLDFREKAPLLADRDMFLDSSGNVVDGLSLRSALASGVPGTVDGLLTLWRDHGSGNIDLHALLVPAVQLAQDGFPLTGELAASLNERKNQFSQDPGASRIFIRADGRPWAEGDRFRQRDLAQTLQRIARDGRNGFYTGATADLIVKQQAVTGGRISYEDLRAYSPIYRPAVTGDFRGYTIVSMGPPSSGGILVVQMLNMLNEFPLESMTHGSVAYVHLLTEVQRRAYADRAEHLGDADFWDVPVARLISSAYAHERVADIALDRATPSAQVRAGAAAPAESPSTTHYSVVDPDGNAVAVTVTLNASFGSGIVIDGAGFLMNNEMDDFSVKPGVPNLYGVTGGDANAIEPGKRMLSSMTPTIVLKDGEPYLIAGSPGGSTIITTVLQVILNLTLHGMNIQDAVNAPRHHSQWLPDSILAEPDAIGGVARAQLERMGHVFAEPRKIGAANCILIDNGTRLGAPDPRRQSAAVGF